ncbi:MAG: mycothiol transferase, partial [Acidimicrobiales bacterium]
MDVAEVLVDGLGRVRDGVHAVVGGLSSDQLSFRPDAEANSIAWLVWHLTRVQDDHVAAAADRDQRWGADDWVARFGLPFDVDATGYGQDAAAVGAVRTGATLLTGYYDAVHGATEAFLQRLEGSDLDRIVDRRWDPPVTLGVRLLSVIDDDLEHVGQARYVRGLGARRGW